MNDKYADARRISLYLKSSHVSWTKGDDGPAGKAIHKMIQSCR